MANQPDVRQGASNSNSRTAAERIIDRHRAAIEAFLREHGVQRLEVFGSAVRDDFEPDDYRNDRMRRSAVERQLEIIGESL
ncbi:MAG: hypothetical protein ABIP53_03345, partial [Candidatus Limnocylindrales bacterium]